MKDKQIDEIRAFIRERVPDHAALVVGINDGDMAYGCVEGNPLELATMMAAIAENLREKLDPSTTLDERKN